MTLADRIAVMKDGLIQQLGTPSDIYNKPQNRYVAGFIGSPEMNFIDGALEGGKTMTFTSGDLSIPMDSYGFAADSKPTPNASLGVRPEQVVTGELATGQPIQADIVVDLVEPMGADTLVWSRYAGRDFRFRMDGQATVRKGDIVHIGFDPAKASLFDSVTELRL
jgi:multiple sugar transport system ATP-binding protein